MTSLKMGSTMQENQPPPSTMHNGRQRLRPFLISLIDSGKVKGLQWLDKEKTLFKIPWKHAGKQDYDPQEDSKIFMLWSRNTGKYKEGIHEPEPAVWKTRLRTALNKLPDIEEVHEKTQLDIPEPYRVYKLLPKKTGSSSSNSAKGPEYHQPRPAIRPTSGNLRGYHTSAGPYAGMDCPEIPHPNYPSHYSTLYEHHYPYQNPVDVSSMSHYSGYSSTNSGYNYFSHPQQPMLSPRHHPYSIGQRPHHNSSSSNGSSVDDLGAITEVINDDVMSSTNIIDHHVHNYTNMDNLDVDLHHQQQQQHQQQQHAQAAVAQLANKGLDSGAGMHQYLNNNDPSQMNYHDPTSVTSAGMTVPYNSPPAGGVPLRSHGTAARDYEQHSSSPPSSAMNAITIASNVLSGEDEGLEACTATAAMSGLCRRPSIKEESYCLPNEHEMSIQLYYRSCDAGKHHIHAEGGCLLYFKEPYEPVKRNMQLIQLPDIKTIPEDEVKGKPREYISKILECCEKGLSLTCRDGCIYVKRHCRSVLFWSTSEDFSVSEKLERDIETKIFDLDRFRHHLRQYYEGTARSPTVPEIHFSIAQKLTDAFPLRACFISFVVRPLRALEELRTINSDARSLPHSSHSGLLKFSGPEMHTETMMPHSISTGLSPWGDITSAYAASCPMVPQPAAMQVN